MGCPAYLETPFQRIYLNLESVFVKVKCGCAVEVKSTTKNNHILRSLLSPLWSFPNWSKRAVLKTYFMSYIYSEEQIFKDIFTKSTGENKILPVTNVNLPLGGNFFHYLQILFIWQPHFPVFTFFVRCHSKHWLKP